MISGLRDDSLLGGSQGATHDLKYKTYLVTAADEVVRVVPAGQNLKVSVREVLQFAGVDLDHRIASTTEDQRLGRLPPFNRMTGDPFPLPYLQSYRFLTAG